MLQCVPSGKYVNVFLGNNHVGQFRVKDGLLDGHSIWWDSRDPYVGDPKDFMKSGFGTATFLYAEEGVGFDQGIFGRLRGQGDSLEPFS